MTARTARCLVCPAAQPFFVKAAAPVHKWLARRGLATLPAGVLAARQASGSVRRWPSCQPGDLSLLAVSSSSLTGRVRLFVVVPVARSSCLTRSANAASPQLPTRKHKPLPQLRFAQ